MHKKRGLCKVGPGVRIKCLDSLLHNGSISRKNGSPFLSLMGISHMAGVSVCLLQDKGKVAGLNTKRTRATKTVKMLSKIRIDLRTMDTGGTSIHASRRQIAKRYFGDGSKVTFVTQFRYLPGGIDWLLISVNSGKYFLLSIHLHFPLHSS